MPYAIILVIVVLIYLYWSSRRNSKKSKKNNVIDIEVVKKKSTDGPLPYKKRQSLLSRREHQIYNTLTNHLEAEKFLILLKVRVLDLLFLPRSSDNYIAFINRIIAKHVDFLIVHSGTLEPMVAIILNNSNEKQDANEDFLKQVFRESGLPLLILTESNYDPIQIMSYIGPYLKSE